MLLLVRHVSTAWSGVRYCGRSDVGISPTGAAELDELLAYLAPTWTHGARVVTSPALRCRQTAAAIAERMGGGISVDDRLWECDFGDAEGMRFREVRRRWADLGATLLREDLRVDWPRGETWLQFSTRIDAVWRELRSHVGDLVVVTHGGPLRQMLAAPCVSVPRGQARSVAPGGVVRLTRKADVWVINSSWSPHAHARSRLA